MNRKENLNRLEEIEGIGFSDVNYLVYLSFHRELKWAVQNFARGRLLDIGCGNKPYQAWFKEKVLQYLGCDVVQSSSNKVDVICEAHKIPFENNSFDTIFSTQVIEHLEHPQAMVNEAYRLLKKDGFFILSGPFYWYLHEEPHDFFRFTKHGFKYILEKAGFEIIEIISNGGAWATLGQVINHTFQFKNPKADKIAKGIKYMFRKLKLFIIVNRIFGYLDRKDFNSINTMNYVVVAKKN